YRGTPPRVLRRGERGASASQATRALPAASACDSKSHELRLALIHRIVLTRSPLPHRPKICLF
ncbi:MAG: hypothetical protein ACO3QC_13225, partial [Phycisphaerales bacterium]